MNESSFFKKVKTIEIIASRLVENFMSGNYRSIFKGQGIEFDEVREYVPGDDSRLIDWNVTSRMGTPFTKTFREERELTLFLIIDVSSSVFAGSGKESQKEITNLIFAILCMSAVVNNDRVGGVFFSDTIEKWVTPGKGKKHALSLISDIIRLKEETKEKKRSIELIDDVVKPSESGKGTELGLALKTVYESLKRRGICIIISDFKTSDYWHEMSLLSRKHDVIAMKLNDPTDLELPDTGVMELRDPETGRFFMTGGPFHGVRKKYKEYWERHYREWRHNCHRRKVQILEINTDEDPGKKLYTFFQRKKR